MELDGVELGKIVLHVEAGEDGAVDGEVYFAFIGGHLGEDGAECPELSPGIEGDGHVVLVELGHFFELAVVDIDSTDARNEFLRFVVGVVDAHGVVAAHAPEFARHGVLAGTFYRKPAPLQFSDFLAECQGVARSEVHLEEALGPCTPAEVVVDYLIAQIALLLRCGVSVEGRTEHRALVERIAVIVGYAHDFRAVVRVTAEEADHARFVVGVGLSGGETFHALQFQVVQACYLSRLVDYSVLGEEAGICLLHLHLSCSCQREQEAKK